MEHTVAELMGNDADMRHDEASLVRAAQTNPTAFSELYQRYMGQVYWYLRARTDSPDDANDLTQLVFLRALEALPNYRERGVPFNAWLFRIARNAAANFHHRQRPTLPWEQVPVADLDTVQGPEAYALRQEALRRMGELLAALEPEKRELLALRFAGGLTSREIAAVVGKSEAAVKKQLARTLQSLKEQYDDR